VFDCQTQFGIDLMVKNFSLQHRIITLCDDNSLHLWAFKNAALQLIRSYPLEGK